MYFPEAANADASPTPRIQFRRTTSYLSRITVLFALLLACLAFNPAAYAQQTTLVATSQGTLDADQAVGPRWIRIDFDSNGAVEHTVNVSWDSNADIRFNIKRDSDNATINQNGGIQGQNPGVWTGELDANELYYISLFSAAGVADYTATVEAASDQPPVTGNVISQDTLDSTKNTAPRFTRFDFQALGTGTHTIDLSWNSTADVRYNVIAPDGSRLNASTIQGANPGIWTGDLQANTTYSISVWSASGGVADYTASLTFDDVPPVSNGELIGTGTVDSARVVATKYTSLAVNPSVTGTHTIEVSWDNNADLNFNVLDANGNRLNASPIQGSNPGVWVGELNANQSYTLGVWSDSGVGNFTATLSADEGSTGTPLAITSLPEDVIVEEGDSASFSVIAEGTGTLEYQWLFNGQAIAGATSATYSINTVGLSDAGTYRVSVTDQNDDVGYASAELTVNTNQQPVTVVNLGEGRLDESKAIAPKQVTIDFNALTTGEHTLSVDWTNPSADVRYIVRSSTGDNITGTIRDSNPGIWTGDLVTGETYTMTLWVASEHITNYTVTLEANVELNIAQRLPDVTVTAGENATFVVDAQGSGNLNYQWFENNVAINGATDNSLTIFSTSLADNGNIYYVQVSDGTDTKRSNNATLTVNTPVSLGLFSQAADTGTWSLEGPAPTLDFVAGTNSDGWGRDLLRIGDVLLVGGDFLGIKRTRNSNTAITDRPWLAALDAVSGTPVTSFEPPAVIDSVVRSLVLSPDKTQVFAGGDFGLVSMNAATGALNYHVLFEDRSGNATNPGRVFDIAVTNTEMYVGGDFTKAGPTFRANLARLSFDGVVDTSWRPNVINGFSSGRGAPVQAVAVSTDEQTVYVGGNYNSIRVNGNETFVEKTPQNADISMLSVSAVDGSVQPERFSATLGNNTKALQVHDIATTDDFVIIAWGGPNFVSFHSADGTQLQQYSGRGDVQAIEIVGNKVFVGHHGEFFGFANNPIPEEAVVSRNPDVFEPFKLHSFLLNPQDMTVEPEQAWRITGPFGVWAISAEEDGLWVAGEILQAGSNERPVEGLVRFPALD